MKSQAKKNIRDKSKKDNQRFSSKMWTAICKDIETEIYMKRSVWKNQYRRIFAKGSKVEKMKNVNFGMMV